MRRALLVLMLVVGAACGTDEPEVRGPPAPASTPTCGKEAKLVEGKPQVEVPGGPPPTELKIEDVTVGTGAEAKSGDKVSVQYVGVCFSSRKEFDASWDRGQPFEFTLGQRMVIQGWDQGVAGMKVGGRRKLTIPPDLAYGSRGAGALIPPGETLVFVVDLQKVG